MAILFVSLLALAAVHASSASDCLDTQNTMTYSGTHTETGCKIWTTWQYASSFLSDPLNSANYCRGINHAKFSGRLWCLKNADKNTLMPCPESAVQLCSDVTDAENDKSIENEVEDNSEAESQTEGQTESNSGFDVSSMRCSNYSGFATEHSFCLEASSVCEFEGGSPVTLTGAEETVALNAHNAKRSLVALGTASGDKVGTVGPAKDMKRMRYNREVGAIAQAWANQCFDYSSYYYNGQVNAESHDCSACRKTADGKYNGQNHFWSASTGTLTSTASLIQEAVDSWYDEINDVTSLAHLVEFDPSSYTTVMIGHFTQVVWTETEEVGCGVTRYNCNWPGSNASKANCAIVVCNYKTGGNYLEDPVYTPATVNSCSVGKPDTQGLCA